jgi:hypothetical protein
VAAARVVEPIYILEYRALGLTAYVLTVAPNQLGFDGFEERLNHRIIMAIIFPTHPLPAVHVYMHERGFWPAKKPLGTLLHNALPIIGLPPFLTLASPGAVAGLLCEDGCSPSQRLHAAPTSDRRAPSGSEKSTSMHQPSRLKSTSTFNVLIDLPSAS